MIVSSLLSAVSAFAQERAPASLERLVHVNQENVVMLYLHDGTIEMVPMLYNAHPQPGSYQVIYKPKGNDGMFRFTQKTMASDEDGTVLRFIKFPKRVSLVQGKTYPADVVATLQGFAHMAAKPNHAQVVPGTVVEYEAVRPFYQPYPSEYKYEWRVYEEANPSEVIEYETDQKFEMNWKSSGRYRIECEVKDPKTGKVHRFARMQEVANERELLDAFFNDLTVINYTQWRAQLAVMELDQSRYALHEQKIAHPFIYNMGQNPTLEYDAGRRFGVAPSSSRVHRFHWYAEHVDPRTQEDLAGPPYAHFVPKPTRIELGQGKEISWALALPGLWFLVCEELDGEGAIMGPPARYLLWVTTQKNIEKIQRFRKFLSHVDEAVEGIRKDNQGQPSLIPLKGAYINKETGDQIQLSLFLGKSQADPNTWILLDLLPGAERMNYTGSTVEEAMAAFERGNSYPEGSVRIQISENAEGIPPINKLLKTSGRSIFAKWSQYIGWISIGLSVAGVIVSFIPVVQVAAPVLFVAARVAAPALLLAAGATGTLAASLSIYDELQKTEPSYYHMAIDVLSIASNMAGMGGAVRMLKTGRALTLLSAGKGRAFAYLGLSTGTLAGVLVGAESVDQLIEISNVNMSYSKKVGAYVRLVANLALQGALMGMSLRDLHKARLRLTGVFGKNNLSSFSVENIHLINMLDDATLNFLRKVNPEVLHSILDCLRVNPEITMQLLQGGRGLFVFRYKAAVDKNVFRFYDALELDAASLLRLHQENTLPLYLALAEQWSSQLTQAESKQVWALLQGLSFHQLGTAELTLLAQLKPNALRSMLTYLGKLPNLNASTFRNVLIRYHAYQRVVTVLKQGAASLSMQDAYLLHGLTDQALGSLVEASTDDVQRALTWVKADLGSANTLLLQPHATRLLQESALFEIPFAFNKNRMVILGTFEMSFAQAIEWSGKNRLAGILSNVRKMHANLSDIDGAAQTFFKRVPSHIFAEESDFVLMASELNSAEILRLVNQLPTEGIVHPERVYQPWAWMVEVKDQGHGITGVRHGPDVPDIVLQTRITNGLIADPTKPKGMVVSPTNASTRFGSYKIWLQTRRAALEGMEKIHGIDLKKPPVNPKDVRLELVVEHHRNIGDGFVGDGPTVKTLLPNGRSKNMYVSTKPISGLTRTRTTIEWNSTTSKWDVKQHFPEANGWDQAMQAYKPGFASEFAAPML